MPDSRAKASGDLKVVFNFEGGKNTQLLSQTKVKYQRSEKCF